MQSEQKPSIRLESAVVESRQGPALTDREETTSREGRTFAEEPASIGPNPGSVVASKNGKAYHLPFCPGAKQISERNKIWFNTVIEAEAAGYRPAGNCKGLK